ncbi:MAG: Serine/threonine protein kinase PrkC, regulator of stationary phase [uncultured Cytophagales bacterium]|uniref:non-specific serine/threonine protein kinase n=1 Tax=uncultured Cytophagales bacterium TaxID=158755 RepID=A0A6J4IU13_9SPHI|nr:MAG: Serine/threonine protein kinase PrkC, regulator of stationary phase [uncultured Cytophagales bacterium]
MVGQLVRNYRIESLLGTGGMGSVYLAVHTQLGRRIAIKVIHPALARNPVVRERFRNEAAALSHLQHPNIVTLYDYSEEEDALYLFMEYVEGKTLDDYIGTETGPIPEEKAVPLFARLLDAVAYAHDRGVIHRDIKPSNLMVNGAGNAKILDFGIAKLTGQGIGGLTKEGTRMGTVLYMSPEQVRGDVLDARSDVYSLGVTLFQVLTGRPPYDEASLTEYAVYQRILHEPLPRMRDRYPLVTERMQAVVDRATAKDPADRFADCHAFREALLDPTLRPAAPVPPPIPEPPLATPTPVPSIPKPAGPRRDTAVTPETPPARAPGRRGAAWVGVLLAAVILIGLLIALAPGDDPSPRRRDTATRAPDRAETTRPREPEPELREEPPAEMAPEEAPTEAVTDSATGPEPAADTTGIPQAPAAGVPDNIRLEYEAVPPSGESSPTDRFAVKIVLSNTDEGVAFDNVTLRIRFLGESGEVLGTYIYEHGRLEPGTVERFNVERRVQAATATCEVLSAQPVTP